MKRIPGRESYEQTLSDPERTQNFYAKWLLGVAIALSLAGYGVKCILLRVGELAGENHGGPLVLHGANAVALGLAFIAVALFVHCQFYWGTKYDEIWFAQLGQIIAGIVFIAAAAILIVRVGVYGIA